MVAHRIRNGSLSKESKSQVDVPKIRLERHKRNLKSVLERAEEESWKNRWSASLCFLRRYTYIGRKKIRVLVLMSDTGGGHRASANALAQALDRRFPGEFEVSLFDIWGAAARLPFNKAVPVYRYMGRRPWLWRAFWYGTALWPARASARKGMEVQLGGRFRRALEPIQPDLVVSVHPMCQHVPLAALTAMAGDKGRIPFVTVVTDLNSAHPQWFDARVDAIFATRLGVSTRYGSRRALISP